MVELIPGVHQVDGVNANSYVVVEKDGSLTLIDTGMAKDGRKILNYVTTQMGRKASDVKTIVITHCHIDHVRGASELKKATGAKLTIHEADADYLSGKKELPRPKGAIGVLFSLFSPFFKITPVEPDQRLKDNDRTGSFTVVHTPGHTLGSISLYDGERKLMFVGDTVRYSKEKIRGPPKALSSDFEQAIQSIQKISNFDFDVMLSGHGEPLKSNASARVKELYRRMAFHA